MEGIEVKGAEMLECGHQNTLSHRLVKLGALLLTCLPDDNAITMATWQDVFIQEVQLELKRHGLEDIPCIPLDIDGAVEQKERVNRTLREAFKRNLGKAMASGGTGVLMPGVTVPVVDDEGPIQ